MYYYYFDTTTYVLHYHGKQNWKQTKKWQKYSDKDKVIIKIYPP